MCQHECLIYRFIKILNERNKWSNKLQLLTEMRLQLVNLTRFILFVPKHCQIDFSSKLFNNDSSNLYILHQSSITFVIIRTCMRSTLKKNLHTGMCVIAVEVHND